MDTPKRDASMRDVVLLMGTIALILVATELFTLRYVVPASRIERRTIRELTEARSLRGDKTLLLVGNSLLLFAVRDSQAELLVRPPYRSRRLVIEQTSYLDWKYGLQELARSGARPTVIGVMLDPGQLVTNQTRTDYSASRLLGARDVIPMGRDAQLHPTEISRLLLSHFSPYYGFRSESRKVLLSRIVPGMDKLVRLLTWERAAPRDTQMVYRVAFDRLRELDSLVSAMGSHMVLLQPPLLHVEGEVRAVRRAARAAGVRVITPGETPPYTASDFGDGYHLAERGAARYVAELRASLAHVLDAPRSAAGAGGGTSMP